MALDDLEQIGKLSDLKEWQLRVLDPDRLPDVDAIERRYVAEAIGKHGSQRLIAAVIVLFGAGATAFAKSHSPLVAAVEAPVWALLAFLTAHLVIRAVGAKAAQRELMPQIAAQCGGVWHERMGDVVPPGNPVSRLRGPRAQHGGDRSSGQSSGRPFGYRERYGDGIVGRLPGQAGELRYGIFNFATIKRRGRTTDTDMYVVLWLELQMPFSDLELKRRWLKGGGMPGRLADRADTKLTSQQVLEMESEEFNRKFKVELPDGADPILVRRMFSPKIQDALVSEAIPLPEEILFHDGRIWIADRKLGNFDNLSAAKTLDYLIFRAQLAASACATLAREVGQQIAPPAANGAAGPAAFTPPSAPPQPPTDAAAGEPPPLW